MNLEDFRVIDDDGVDTDIQASSDDSKQSAA